MPNLVALEDHERMRWSMMGRRQLRTRLNRITKPEKLALFMRLAMEQREDELFELATARATELRVGHLPVIGQVVDEYYFRRQDDTYTSRTPAREKRWKAEVPVLQEKPTVRKIRF